MILWSVIRDQWFWIEFFKFFLKICQPLEISLRSAIHDPQLIFVFWLRETFWQGWYALNSVIRDPQLRFVFWLRKTPFWQGWYAFNSVICDQWFMKLNSLNFSQNLPAFRNLAAICDPWSATNICILIKRDFLSRLVCK